MDANSIAKGIQQLVTDAATMNVFVNNLKKEQLGTEGEMSKLYDLIETTTP
jgi:hypothetical protein